MSKLAPAAWFEPLVGSVVVSVLTIAVNHTALKSQEPILSFMWLAVSIAIGGFIGWLFRTVRNMKNDAEYAKTSIDRSMKQLDEFERTFVHQLRHFFKQNPFSIFLEESVHSGVLGSLIRDSIECMNGKVYKVHENKYLLYLKEAISHSDTYLGVQRRPVRWFRDTTGAPEYLTDLQNREMKSKRRIFVIDSNEVQDMKEDLENKELMEFYWLNTGDNVETFYIEEFALRDTISLNGGISDFALYDDHLLIRYDPQSRIVSYDLLSESLVERQLVHFLEEQLEANRDSPFVRIVREGALTEASR
ncbi:MAG: hypothetical protein GY906_07335 [bacterium]|nr:hypothetical protein [bacterium]